MDLERAKIVIPAMTINGQAYPSQELSIVNRRHHSGELLVCDDEAYDNIRIDAEHRFPSCRVPVLHICGAGGLKSADREGATALR